MGADFRSIGSFLALPEIRPDNVLVLIEAAGSTVLSTGRFNLRSSSDDELLNAYTFCSIEIINYK